MKKKGKGSGYVHVHNHNPKARDSDERKIELLRGLEVKRFQGYVDKRMTEMRSYIPPEKRKRAKPDPAFVLKGAARAAQEYYRPPGWEPEPEPRNLLDEYFGNMYEIEEGRLLLGDMLALGVAMYNLKNRKRDTIKLFKQMMEYDTKDSLSVRHHLLRCYLDTGAADKARGLLSKFPDDNSCCFKYSFALIEFISLMLNESGSSEQLRDDALRRAYAANEFALWTLAYHDVFENVVEHTDKIVSPAAAGTVLDAIHFFEVDSAVWMDTDGAIEWVREFIQEQNLSPPAPPAIKISPNIQPETGSKKRKAEDTKESAEPVPDINVEEMFLGMFHTAIEMAESE